MSVRHAACTCSSEADVSDGVPSVRLRAGAVPEDIRGVGLLLVGSEFDEILVEHGRVQQRIVQARLLQVLLQDTLKVRRLRYTATCLPLSCLQLPYCPAEQRTGRLGL